MKGGKTKIVCPIYYEETRPPTAGVPETVIEKEMVSRGQEGGGGGRKWEGGGRAEEGEGEGRK